MEETFKKDIRSIKEEELKDILELQGEPSFRAKQILDWVWRKSIASFDEMSNVGLSLRESLNDSFTLHKVKEDIRQESADGTIKYRIELHDGLKIEAVMIPTRRWQSNCRYLTARFVLRSALSERGTYNQGCKKTLSDKSPSGRARAVIHASVYSASNVRTSG